MTTTEELRPDIARAWETLSDRTFLKRSVATLHEHLQEGETVTQLASASHGADGGTGLLVLTGRRLLFHRRSRSSAQFFEVPWTSGSSVAWTSGWVVGSVTVTSGGTQWTFTAMHKTDGERFATTLRTHTFSEPEAVAPPWYAAAPPVEHEPEPATGAADDDVIGRLERLGALYERGILDEAEFATAKADLLRRLSGGTTPS